MKNIRHFCKIIVLVVIISWTLYGQLFAQFSGGKGSRFRPYHISTAEDLDLVRSYPSKHFRLINDIDLSDYEWQSIGDQTNPFTGTFDGRGFNITNLQIESKGSYTGLFGFVKGGRIKDVLLTDVYLIGSDYTGALAGRVEKSKITNCGAEGKVFGTVNVGGLIGYSNSSKVERCYASVDIYSNESNIGGLIGNCDMANQIVNCYATGNVEGGGYVGGLIGILRFTAINNCYSTGKIVGYSKGNNIGGLIGNFEGGNNSIVNCYWDVVTSSKNSSIVGEGLMTIDMLRDNSEYTDWDFDDTWAMVDYTTYPYLKWQGEPGVHNYPKHGHHKVYEGRTVYWESFPVLPYNEIDFAYILKPLTDLELLENVYAQNEVTISWDNAWSGALNFVKTRGYKLEFVDDDEYVLIVPGTAVDYDNTTITLKPAPNENWVGYWIPQPQHFSDVFDDPEFDYVQEVRGEGWTVTRSPEDGSWGSIPSYAYLYFGKMYEIYISGNIDKEFSWPLPTEPCYPPNNPIATPGIYGFRDGPNYEVFNIESIENDQDVVEVGVFAGDICVGASVFTGEYPLQILAYTNASHSEEVISFAIHRSARGEDSNIRTVEVLDSETGEYYEEILQPEAKRITTLRLGAGDEIVEVVKPQFTLSQNYPNPIVMSQVSRSSELTKIDFSLPEAAEVSLNVYNIKGQLVKILASGELSAGRHTVSWDGNNVNNQPVSSGVYFYRLDNGKKTINRKMLIIK